MSTAESIDYVAFLSYRHQAPDQDVAVWLQERLERYRVPRGITATDLRGKRLGRVFRDATEMSVAPSLSAQLQLRLAVSRFLIVVCSPRTGGTENWVNREVEHFLNVRGVEYVLPVLIEGNEKTSYPAALQALPDPPLAATLISEPGRNARSLRHVALLKLVARLIGVEFDQLYQRDRRRRRQQAGSWAVSSMLVVALVVFLLIQYAAEAFHASRQRQSSLAKTLASFSRGELEKGYHDRAALLARQAWIANAAGDGSAHAEVYEALRAAMSSEAFCSLLWLGKEQRPTAVAISGDGRHLAASVGNEVATWEDRAGSRARRRLAGSPGMLAWLEFTRGDRELVGVNERGELYRWRVEEPHRAPEVLALDVDARANRFACDRDASLFARVDDQDRVYVRRAGAGGSWDALDREADAPAPDPEAMRAIALAEDARSLAVLTPSFGVELWKWNESASSFQREERLMKEAHAIAFGDGGRSLFVSRQGSIARWNIAGAEVQKMAEVAIPALAIGHLMCSSSGSRALNLGLIEGSIHLANLADPEPSVRGLPLPSRTVIAACASADLGRVLFSTNDGLAVLCDLGTAPATRSVVGIPLHETVRIAPGAPDGLMRVFRNLGLRSRLRQLAGSVDGELLAFTQPNAAVSDVVARVVKARTPGQEPLLLRGGTMHALSGMMWLGTAITALAFEPRDGGTRVLGGMAGRVFLWNTADGSRTEVWSPEQPIVDLAWCATTQQALAACADGKLGILDLARGAPVAVVPAPDGVATCLVASRGEAVAFVGTSTGALTLLSLPAGTVQKRLEAAHTGAVVAMSASPNSRILATAGADGIVALWDAAAGLRKLHALPIHEGRAVDLSFSSDGKLLAVAMQVREVDAAAAIQPSLHGEAPGPMPLLLVRLDHLDWPPARLAGHEGGVAAVSFDPAGRYLASFGDDDRLILWSAVDGDRLSAAVAERCWRNLSLAEWKQFAGGVLYEETCPGLPALSEN